MLGTPHWVDNVGHPTLGTQCCMWGSRGLYPLATGTLDAALTGHHKNTHPLCATCQPIWGWIGGHFPLPDTAPSSAFIASISRTDWWSLFVYKCRHSPTSCCLSSLLCHRSLLFFFLFFFSLSDPNLLLRSHLSCTISGSFALSLRSICLARLSCHRPNGPLFFPSLRSHWKLIYFHFSFMVLLAFSWFDIWHVIPPFLL